MGAAQSIPSEVEEVHFAATPPPRNKLTKPRTNSNATREPSCLPFLPSSISRSSLLGNSKPSLASQYQIAEDQPPECIFSIEYADTTQPNTTWPSGKCELVGGNASEFSVHYVPQPQDLMASVDSTASGVVSSTLVIPRRGSTITRSSTNSSAGYAPPPNRGSELPSMGTVRRRSQLLAAPPATATRKPARSHKQTQSLSDTLSSPDLFTLVPPSDNDTGRCTTPSGYSVLGAFKRGSLRIANGAASPVPSSSRASPELPTRTGYFGSGPARLEVLKDRPTSRDKPLILLTDPIIPTHEVRLVPQSPINWMEVGEDRELKSPFSFTRSPSIYDEDILGSSLVPGSPTDDPLGGLRPSVYDPSGSCESLLSVVSSTVSTGLEYHKILTEQYLNRDSFYSDIEVSQMATPALYTEVDEYHKILFKEAQKESSRCPRRPSITKVCNRGTDSGYSSSGSINSWKTVWSEQHRNSDTILRKREGLGVTPKSLSGTASVEKGMEIITEPDVVSRRKIVVAAIRRRYSQGDLKSFARNNESTKGPQIPTTPTTERKKPLTKPRPELKHRRSMIVVTKSPVSRYERSGTSSTILPVPPLPKLTKLERKGAYNHLTVEDYLPLIEDFPLSPVVDHATDIFPANAVSNMQDSIVKIGVGRILDRGSKITGQDYYQRFSRQSYAGKTIVS